MVTHEWKAAPCFMMANWCWYTRNVALINPGRRRKLAGRWWTPALMKRLKLRGSVAQRQQQPHDLGFIPELTYNTPNMQSDLPAPENPSDILCCTRSLLKPTLVGRSPSAMTSSACPAGTLLKMSLQGRKWPPRGITAPFSPRRWSTNCILAVTMAPNVRFQCHFLGTVASEKINKEYLNKYKYIQRAVNDNTAGSREECVFIPLEGNDLYPSWHFPSQHQWGSSVCACVSYHFTRS